MSGVPVIEVTATRTVQVITATKIAVTGGIRWEVTVAVPGMQGPAGPRGMQGPAGPQGPAGDPGGVSSLNGEHGDVTLTAADLGLAVPVIIPVMIPATTWTFAHSFPYPPDVITYDSGGNVIDGDVAYPAPGTVTVTWDGLQVGSAELK